MGKKGVAIIFLRAFFLGGAFFLGTILTTMVRGPALLDQVQASEGSTVDFSSDIAKVAKQNIPSVVHIKIKPDQYMVSSSLSELNQFFRYFLNVPYMPKKFKKERKRFATGIIMDSRGYILTNYHLLTGASEIQLLLSNGKTYPARIVGSDPDTDLAVIKIAAKDSLPYVVFGDSDKMNPGEWVVAIGCPSGLDHTVTQGIISADHRRGHINPNCYQDFLQTDAAINPGNSGGPLLNLKGKVIGVNAAIVSQSGGFEGVGFAIPSNMAVHIAEELIKHGKVQRGWLGVTVNDLTTEQAMKFGVESRKGVLITEVIKGGPADMAGIKKGDVVTDYQGDFIADSKYFFDKVTASQVGKPIKLSIYREGKPLTLTAKIGELQQAVNEDNHWVNTNLGVEVRPVTFEEIRRFGLDSHNGVVIISILPESPLKKVGFEINDIVLEINGEIVINLKSFFDTLSALRSKQRATILALDHRTGRMGYVQMRMP